MTIIIDDHRKRLECQVLKEMAIITLDLDLPRLLPTAFSKINHLSHHHTLTFIAGLSNMIHLEIKNLNPCNNKFHFIDQHEKFIPFNFLTKPTKLKKPKK